MAYMDQGNEIVRESPFVQVGGQTMRTPTSVNLDEMFKAPSTPAGQFQAPAGPEVAPIVTEGPSVSESVGAGAYLEKSEEWQKYSGVGGDYYMPTSGKTGDFYKGPDDQLYEWKEGQGWALVGGATKVQEFKGTVSEATSHVATYRNTLDAGAVAYNMYSTVNNLSGLGATAAIAQLEEGRIAALQAAQAKLDAVTSQTGGRQEVWEAAHQKAKNAYTLEARDINAAFASMIDAVDGLSEAKQSLIRAANSIQGVDISDLDLSTKEGAIEAESRINNALIGKDYEGLLRLQGTTITQDFGSGVSDMMQQIDSGEFSFYDENGDLDIEGMISAGGAEGWLGESLQAATESGFLRDDFMQMVDDPENPGGPQIEVFSDEIQGVMDVMDDQMSDQQQRFMSDLKYSAAQQGFSVEDVIFSKQRLAFKNEATAQFANEFAGMLDREMEAGYTSMGASLESLIRQNWSDEKALTFKTEYERQMSEALKDYRVQDQI
ncbi:hypothetical protein LCGC14_2285260, partial [marine sediment metagenome]